MNLTGKVEVDKAKVDDNESQDTFIDPRKILGKETLHERKLPNGMEFHEEGRYNLDKNKYFKGYKQKWDNEMFHVVQEYQTNIFPQTMKNANTSETIDQLSPMV